MSIADRAEGSGRADPAARPDPDGHAGQASHTGHGDPAGWPGSHAPGGPFDAPWLTIVIPTLNRAALVERAVLSALAQDDAGIEIIVSDNGSRDATPQVLERLVGRHPGRIRHVRHEQTMPAEVHGNWLIEQARGQLFLGLSDDDHLEPGFGAALRALWRRRPQLRFVYTRCIVHYGSVQVPTLRGPEVESGVALLRAFLAGRREICWCACVTRTAELRAIGPIPAGQIFGDMYCWMQLAQQGDVGCIGEALAHYRFMHEDNLSAGVPVPLWAAQTQALVDLSVAALRTQHDPVGLARDARRFVARSTANQFVWNAIRGASRATLIVDAARCARVLLRAPEVWPRLVAAIALPRRWTRALVLRAAARRGTERGADSGRESGRDSGRDSGRESGRDSGRESGRQPGH